MPTVLAQDIVLNKEADFYMDPYGLAERLFQEIQEFQVEVLSYDKSDTFYNYMQGLIAAREVILDRIGAGYLIGNPS